MATNNAKGSLLDTLAKRNHVINTIDARKVEAANDLGLEVRPTHLHGEERTVYQIGQRD